MKNTNEDKARQDIKDYLDKKIKESEALKLPESYYKKLYDVLFGDDTTI